MCFYIAIRTEGLNARISNPKSSKSKIKTKFGTLGSMVTLSDLI